MVSKPMPLLLGAIMACAAAAARPADAQDYPTRPVRIVVGFAPGGSSDIAARVVGQWLSERLGKQFVIENRPGTASHIAAETVVRAAPDGHTLLLVSSSDTINATLHPKPGYVFLRDIAAVAGLTQQPQLLLANPKLPARSLGELIAHAKASPGGVTIASAGNGSISHLAGALLAMTAGLDLVHMPYRGAGPALTDLVAGHVQTSFAGMAGSTQHVKSGRLIVLAVTTTGRSTALPDVPAIAEHHPGYMAVSLFGIGAPRATPAEIIEKLNREINAALADPQIEARFADLGGTVLPGPPAAFARLLEQETQRWASVIASTHIKPE